MSQAPGISHGTVVFWFITRGSDQFLKHLLLLRDKEETFLLLSRYLITLKMGFKTPGLKQQPQYVLHIRGTVLIRLWGS